MNDHTKTKSMLDNIKSEDGSLRYYPMTTLKNIVIVTMICDFWMNRNTLLRIKEVFHYGLKHGRINVPLDWSPIDTAGDVYEKEFNSFMNFGPSKFRKVWPKIESDIKQEVYKLHLPDDVIEKLSNLVPLVGKAIINWIRCHDKYIFNSNNSKYHAVDFIDSIAWTPTGKIDYAQTAKNILANEDNCLSNVVKSRLAYAYCLKEEIAILAPNVCGNMYLNQMMHIWTGTKTFSDPSFCFRILIQNKNEVPIKYMWDKLSEKEKSKHIIPLINKLESQDLTYFLLSTLNYQQQQQVFKECFNSILSGILKDWLWEEYFLPTALHILDFLKPLSYAYILRMVLEQRKKNGQPVCKGKHLHYNSIFMELWQKGPMQFKKYIFERENGLILSKFVHCLLSWKVDMNVIDLIFNDLNTHQKKNLMFGFNGMRHCVLLIHSGEWDNLEFFVNYTLSSEEDISQLKRTLRTQRGVGIALHFLKRRAFYKLKKFLSWSCKSEEELSQFKLDIVRNNECRAYIKSFGFA